MSYAKNALVSGEQILHRGHFHWMDKLTALMLCCVAVGVFLIIRMWATEIVVTNRRLIYKRGWVARKTEEISLSRIEEVNLRQGALERIFVMGVVQVQGMGGGDIMLPRMGAPMKFKRELQQAQARAETMRR